ncbi:MAG: hypothetical protein LV480_07695 [Methylacidiphilales bacterium]|nr:hypothetical protein [Candidatus Methylacidiphilales bacterium]
MSAFLTFSTPAFGESDDMLKQAEDLVHQAWNPAGDPPSYAQRTDLLTQAMKLLQNVPQHYLKGLRVQAINDIKAALYEIKQGDPNNKATSYIRDADSRIRSALAITG